MKKKWEVLRKKTVNLKEVMKMITFIIYKMACTKLNVRGIETKMPVVRDLWTDGRTRRIIETALYSKEKRTWL